MFLRRILVTSYALLVLIGKVLGAKDDTSFQEGPWAQLSFRVACAVRYQLLGFQLTNYDEYPTYFREDSVMELAQAGTYKGLQAIQEYVTFTAPDSTYLTGGTYVISDMSRLGGYDPKTGLCIFDLAVRRRFETDPTTTNPDTLPFDGYSGAKLYYDLCNNYITRIDLWFPLGLVNHVFVDILESTQTRDYICNQLATSCAPYISDFDAATCQSNLAALPAVTNGEYSDGDSSGCRALHAAFVSLRPEVHCAHVSLSPTDLDPDGSAKCSQSKGTLVSDVFAEEDLAFFRKFVADNGVDPDVGFVSPGPVVADPPFWQGACDTVSLLLDVFLGDFVESREFTWGSQFYGR